VARTAEVGAVERVLETFAVHMNSVSREHDGTIRYSNGDAYLVTFPEASQAATAAVQFMRAWAVASDEDRSGCDVHLLLHRGTINVFRSFLYGKGSGEAWQVMDASRQWLGEAGSALFITAPVRDALSGDRWHNRLRPVGDAPSGGPELYRFGDA
jgi:class 3 adenylate cyclase